MKIKRIDRQRGSASLFIAVMLIIGITLVIFSTSKTVLMETKINAANYRTIQATTAANAAMDQGVAYFMAGGLDQDGTAGVDFVAGTVSTLTLTSGTDQTTTGLFYFANTTTYDHDNNAATAVITNPCDSNPSGFNGINMTQGIIVTQGFSDDGTAVRTMSQCLGTFDLFDGGESPQQPFVSKAGVGVFGNAKIINRYSNISIWAGGVDAVHGAAYGTYLRPSDKSIGDYTAEQLDSSCATSPCNVANNPGPNTQLVSNRDTGNGVDVITEDATLASKTPDEFFDMFFAKTKSQIKKIAQDSNKVFASGASIDGEKGLIWVDGNIGINGTDVIGTATEPAILIVDGNLDKLNGATIYGIVYVIGTLEVAGSPIIKGSLVAENSAASTGAGTLTLVFKPWGGGDSSAAPPFIEGTGAVIAGSWKDW